MVRIFKHVHFDTISGTIKLIIERGTIIGGHQMMPDYRGYHINLDSLYVGSYLHIVGEGLHLKKIKSIHTETLIEEPS